MAPRANSTAADGQREAGFHFSLWQLFVAVFMLSVYFALARLAGDFAALLIAGTIVVGAGITVLRIDNLLLGGVVGACLAGAILACAGWACVTSPGALFACWLLYPPLGYALGLAAVAQRSFKAA